MNKLFNIIFLLVINISFIKAEKYYQKSIDIDTINIGIKHTVFCTRNGIYDCFIIKSENQFFISKEHLDNYIKNTFNVTYWKNDKRYINHYNLNEGIDTLRAINNLDIDYTVRGEFIKDVSGTPILWYDLQISYLFNYFNENYSHEFIYVINIKDVMRTDLKYYKSKFYTLLKLDLKQDTVSNFFSFIKSFQGEKDLILLDSTLLSNRKLCKLKKSVALLNVYNGALQPYIQSNNIDILIVNNERYLLETDYPPLNKEGNYIVGRVLKYTRKYFDLPYFEKEK